DHSCYSEAEPYFRKVEQLTPDNYLAFNNLGATYLKLGDTSKAIGMLRKSIDLLPNARHFTNLGMAYVLQQNPAEAAIWHRKATQLTPGNERYWGNLALALRWTQQSAEAPEAFHHAIELAEHEVTVNPREPQIHARLGEYWAALGNTANSN